MHNPERFAHDFNQRYAETFALVSWGSAPQVVYISSAESDGDPFSKKFPVYMTTYDGKKKVVLFETLQIIEGIPSPKYVNTDTSAVFFFRRAKRQWKRGLCSSTVGWVPANLDLYPDKAETILTQSKIPWSGRNRMVTWFQSPIRSNINFAWAQRLLETNPLPSYEEAFQRLQNLKAAAVAFDDRYALVLNWHSPNFRLCRDGIKIAEVHKDNPYLVLNHAPLFHQEIKDLYRRMGKEAKVE